MKIVIGYRISWGKYVRRLSRGLLLLAVRMATTGNESRMRVTVRKGQGERERERTEKYFNTRQSPWLGTHKLGLTLSLSLVLSHLFSCLSHGFRWNFTSSTLAAFDSLTVALILASPPLLSIKILSTSHTKYTNFSVSSIKHFNKICTYWIIIIN